jgi:hypothetical protein
MDFKSDYINHNDTKLLKYINPINNITVEKIVNKVIPILDSIGNSYKYALFTSNNNQYLLNPTNNYYIGDPFLFIQQTYIYNSTTYIFTNKQIPIENQLYSVINTTTEYFDQLDLFKSVPDIISKINLSNKMKPYMILNSLKTWDIWSILSANKINQLSSLLNKGNIIYNENNFTYDLSNTYFTNTETNYFKKLLIFINNNNIEQNKIAIQTNLLNNVIGQLEYWINDSTFWSNVTNRINEYLIDLNINAEFNGSCLVFSDEIDISSYFDYTDPDYIKRKYYLNNQYILINNNKITRNMDNILNETIVLINNTINKSSYGIEINNLLYTLYNYGEEYKNIMTNIYLSLDENKHYNCFSSLKLFINNIWNNYKHDLNLLNKNFNDKLLIKYSNTDIISNYFTNNFQFNSASIIDLSNEIFILDNQQNFYLLSNPVYPYNIVLSSNIIIPEVIYQLNFYNIYYDSVLFNLQKYPIELNFYLNNDLETNIDYSIVGLTNYTISSIFLGNLFKLSISNINYNFIDYINYKNNLLYIYKYDISNIYLSSQVNIENNHILEIYKNIGLKSQNNNFLVFYQKSFNYLSNSTYIKHQDIYYPLNIDISCNYYIDSKLLLPQIINIVILYNIFNITSLNTYIYHLNLNTPFLNYNQYINSITNIIPINFLLNDIFTPIEVIFKTIDILVVQTHQTININAITHYANIGETPPIQLVSLEKLNKYLYQTNEPFNLLSNSKIWLSDSSNYLFGQLANIDNLTFINTIQFIINYNYSVTDLINMTMYIVTEWIITDYIINPLNNNIIFNFPLMLNLINSSYYSYTINGTIVGNTNVYVNNNQLITNYYLGVSGPFTFGQIYNSPSAIYKPVLNQVAKIKLINNYQNINNGYLLPLDQYGYDMGLYLYKIILQYPVNQINILNIELVGNTIYSVNLLLWLNDSEIIISTNEILTNQNYKIKFGVLVVVVLSLTFYQESYQNTIFYYQTNINAYYIFCDQNSNSLNFENQINEARYYMHTNEVTTTLDNLFNPRKITRSNNMLIQNINNTTTNIILEKPIISVSKIFSSLSLFLGDQLIETINEDTYKILLNYYLTDEKKNQLTKVMKIIENNNGWEVYFPLLFWFYYQSNLAIPLIALPYTDLTLKFQINNLNSILENNLTGSKFSTNPQISFEICLDTILLDIPERTLFGSYNHEYIIEKFVIYPDNLIYNEAQTVNLKYNNLVKDIFWITKPIYHPNTTSYQTINYIYDAKYQYYLTLLASFTNYNLTYILTEINIGYINDYQILRNNNQEIIINNSFRLLFILNDSLLNKYDIHFVLFILDKYLLNIIFENQIKKLKLYFIHLYKNEKTIYEYSPIKNLNVQSNGVDFMPNFDNNYYNYVIPYQKFLNSPPLGYYTTSFSLNPCEKQPSGHLNFNSFDNVVLNLTSDPNVLIEPFNLTTVVKEYQILRIMSGMGALAWIN